MNGAHTSKVENLSSILTLVLLLTVGVLAGHARRFLHTLSFSENGDPQSSGGLIRVCWPAVTAFEQGALQRGPVASWNRWSMAS